MDKARKAYERFRLQWMLEHGHTLPELINELQKLREEGDPEMSLQALFEDWEFGYGFGSEIWPCFEEYLSAEYTMIKEENLGAAHRGMRRADHMEGNMQVLLSNPARPDTEGVTLPFPIPDAEYEKCLELLATIGLGDAAEQDCVVEAVFNGPPALDCLIGRNVNVDELDCLAKILDNICDDGDLEKFEAMAEVKGYTEIKDLINLSLCCQNVGIITDFSKFKEAGEDYITIHPGRIPTGKAEGEDGEAILKTLIAEGKGRITRYGVLFDSGVEVEQIYRGGNLPAVGNGRILVEAQLTPTLEPQDREELLLLLPMPEKQLERLLERAGFETNDDFNAELRYMELPPEVNAIIERQPKALYDINRLCHAICPEDGKQMEKLAAAVLLAKPQYASEIAQLAINLELFDHVTDIGSAEEYGEYLIKESGNYTFDENLARYYDYDKCGREQMESEQGAFTALGYIAYHGKLPLEDLMMDEPAEAAPESLPQPFSKRRPHHKSPER